jgi:hypothetical protein
MSSVNCAWYGFNPSVYSKKYYNGHELGELLARNGFDYTLYAGFFDQSGGLVNRMVRHLRQVAVKLRLIPRTMKGKKLLKRLFYGKLTMIPREITEDMAPLEPLIEVTKLQDLAPYKMIYAVARKRAETL